jgi:UDP-N-acetylglucosamine 1-carboxyvinyltransferase
LKAIPIQTAPEPGFMTDWQPLWVVLMTQAQGVSRVIERVHNNRLQYAQQLNEMGAKIDLYNPEIEDPKAYYEFDWDSQDANYHAAKIHGPTPLKGISLRVPDLRGGATLTIAALVASGQTTLENIELIERGYEDLNGRLGQLGAKIDRIDLPNNQSIQPPYINNTSSLS